MLGPMNDLTKLDCTPSIPAAARPHGPGSALTDRPTRAWFVSCGLILSAIGCGSSDSGIDTRVTTSVPEDQPLRELSAAEARSFCLEVAEDVRSFFGAIRESYDHTNICTVGAAIGTNTEADCNNAKDMCIEQRMTADDDAFAELPGDDDDDDFLECDDDFAEGASECPNLRIGDILACFNEFLDEVRASLQSSLSLTCADAPTTNEASLADFGLSFASFGTSATCRRLAADCPTLFDDDDDDDDDYDDDDGFESINFSGSSSRVGA